ncbi:MAG TPA: hypothetical protein VJ809_11145 [Pirellulales bacterium]|nr:hypothetical protein [Pirellulales bacterium]
MIRFLAVVSFAILLAASTGAEERTQSFDRDPGWDGRNNRAKTPEPREVRQDFGYSATKHLDGGARGAIGGYLTPAAETAYYAKRIPAATFNDRLSASGKLACPGRQYHVLLGFFNADTVNEWRTPNSIVLRLYGRGDVFYAYVEYCTSRWRAGGDSPGGFATVEDTERPGRQQLRGFKSQGAVHTWSLDYDPTGHGGRGCIVATIDDQRAVCNLDEGHKADGATFNRCGLLCIPKHFDSGGEVWLDDITINGQLEDFAGDPGWDAVGNRRTYTTYSVRPRFDFGFSDTHFAGGKSRGELGGVVFRGDNRTAEKMAYYGDRLERVNLKKPLRAGGKVSLRRGISDSTSLIGFFHSEKSMEVSQSQSSGWPKNFFGVAIEGPSREGFFFYPAYRLADGSYAYARGDQLPQILPDGKSHDWSLEYDPTAGSGRGRVLVSLDGKRAELVLGEGHRESPVEFNRFGIVTTWIDGNAQHVYFDDLTYTCRQVSQ